MAHPSPEAWPRLYVAYGNTESRGSGIIPTIGGLYKYWGQGICEITHDRGDYKYVQDRESINNSDDRDLSKHSR